MKQLHLWQVFSLFCLLFIAQELSAQNYQSYILDSTISFKWEEFYGAAPTEILALAGEDEVYAVPLPFSFRYFDSTYSAAFVGMNGYVSFGRNYSQSDFNREHLCYPVSQLYDPSRDQDALNPDNFIAAFWSDLFLDPTCKPLDGGSPQLAYRTKGVAPNREFIVVWDYFVQSGDLAPCTTVDSTFGSQLRAELRLYEGTNVIEVHVKKNLLTTQDATIAVENAAGDYAVYANCDLNNPGDSLMAYRFTPSTDPPVVTPPPPTSGYCAASGVDCIEYDRYITNVQIADLNHSSGCSTGGYSDFTSNSANVVGGTTYQITVEVNDTIISGINNRTYAWIDWNQDSIFNVDTEAITLVGNGAQDAADQRGLWVGLVTVPDTLGTITTRMRLRHTFLTAPGVYDYNNTPCGPDDAGEVEDYHINVNIPITGYCVAKGGNCATAPGSGSVDYDHIVSATITTDGADVVNNSGCDNGYGDFTGISALKVNWSEGNQYTITVKRKVFDYTFGKASAYIDWNQDMDFSDSGEEFVGIANPLDSTTSFTILSDSAQLGITRLRIRTMADTTDVPEPCGTQLMGEVEDYKVLISDPSLVIPGCVSTTTPVDGAMNLCQVRELTWNAVANATGYRVSLWQASPSTVVIMSDVQTTNTYIKLAAPLDTNKTFKWIVIPYSTDGDAVECDTLYFSVSADPDPIAQILPDFDTIYQCTATPLQLDGNPQFGTGPNTHSWNGTNNALLSDTAIVNPVFAGASSGTYRYSYTVMDSKGCSGSDTVVISIVPAVVGGTLTATKASFCTGGATTIKHSGFFGNVQIQDSTAASGMWRDTNLTKVDVNVYGTGSLTQTTYYRAVVSAGSCADTSDMITVTVFNNPFPPTYVASGPTTFCLGDSVVFAVTNYTSGLTWNSASTTTATTATVKIAGNYFVKVKDANGCESTSVTSSVTTNPSPNKPQIQILGDPLVCTGDSVVLFVNNPNIDVMEWNDAAATMSDTLVVYDPGSYVVTATALGCSTTSGAVELFFNANPPKPEVNRIGSEFPCVGDTIKLISNISNNITWRNGSTNDTITITANGVHWVTYQVGNCVAVSDNIDITFTPIPAAPVITRVGDSLIASGNGYIYQWIGPEGPISGVYGNVFFPSHGGVYYVVVYTEEGCGSPTSQGYNVIGTGVSEIDNVKWQVYPNPVNDVLYIESADDLSGEIILVNAIGEEVIKTKATGKLTKLTLDGLSPGLYLINYLDGERLIHKPVIKN